MKTLFYFTLTLAGLLISNTQAQTVVSDTVIMGPGYANQVFYNLATKSKTANAMGSWHLAHTSDTRDNCIRANHAAGINVYAYPNGDNSAYANFDTTGWMSWTHLMNDIHKHQDGAFNRSTNPNNQWDFSWGVYDAGSHTVKGDSLYLITRSVGGNAVEFIKFMPIEQDASGNLLFRWDYIGGSKSTADIDTLEQGKSNGATYKYWHFSNKQVSLEPSNAAWDLNFTRYYEPTFNGTSYVPYLVMGVESRRGLEVARVKSATWDDLTAAGGSSLYPKDTTGLEGFKMDLTRVGSNWKSFNGQAYVLADSLTFIARNTASGNSDLYLFHMVGFVGNSAGKIMLNSLQVAPSANVASVETATAVVYPNPANNDVFVIPTSSNQIQEIAIRSLDGRLIRKATTGFNNGEVAKVNVSGLVSGNYILEVKTAAGAHSQIIVKQ